MVEPARGIWAAFLAPLPLAVPALLHGGHFPAKELARQSLHSPALQRHAGGMEGVRRAAARAHIERVPTNSILHWTGLTNMTYTVQRSPDLLAPWSTVGWLPAVQTNLAFTNWLTGPLQFYRLAVP